MATIDQPLTALPSIDAAIELVPLFRGVWALSPYILVPGRPCSSGPVAPDDPGRAALTPGLADGCRP